MDEVGWQIVEEVWGWGVYIVFLFEFFLGMWRDFWAERAWVCSVQCGFGTVEGELIAGSRDGDVEASSFFFDLFVSGRERAGVRPCGWRHV